MDIKPLLMKSAFTSALPSVENFVTDASDNGLCAFYSAGHPEHPEWLIYEYAGGRKILVEINLETGKEHFLRSL